MTLMHEMHDSPPLHKFALRQAELTDVCSGASCGSARTGGTGAGCRRALPGGGPAQQPCAGGVASRRGLAPGMPAGACARPCQRGCSTHCTGAACTAQRCASELQVIRRMIVQGNMDCGCWPLYLQCSRSPTIPKGLGNTHLPHRHCHPRSTRSNISQALAHRHT